MSECSLPDCTKLHNSKHLTIFLVVDCCLMELLGVLQYCTKVSNHTQEKRRLEHK